MTRSRGNAGVRRRRVLARLAVAVPLGMLGTAGGFALAGSAAAALPPPCS